MDELTDCYISSNGTQIHADGRRDKISYGDSFKYQLGLPFAFLADLCAFAVKLFLYSSLKQPTLIHSMVSDQTMVIDEGFKFINGFRISRLDRASVDYGHDIYDSFAA